MKNIYRKMFDIEFNSKVFTIFLDENNRRTFLEKNEKGEYSYPTLEDFTNLNNLYNNVNPFIVNMNKYTFQEKVIKNTLGALAAVTVMTSSGCALKDYGVELVDNIVNVMEENLTQKELLEITDVNQLDEILGYKEVSIENIHRAIDNNDKIEKKYKRKLHLFIEALVGNYPNIDLRIFYENVKTMELIEVDEEYFQKTSEKSIGGRYNGNLNQLLIPVDTSDMTFYHEISHITDLYYRETDDTIIYRGPT